MPANVPAPAPVHGQSFDSILAQLHLHAVLPALEDLCEVAPAARDIAASWEFTLRLALARGPAATLVSREGRLSVSPGREGRAALVLQFLTSDQLNRMFLNKKALPPLPTFGFWRVAKVQPFIALTKILEQYLKPAADSLTDPEFRRAHLRLLFRVLVGAVGTVGSYDSPSNLALRDTPSGTAEIRAPALGNAKGWVSWDRTRSKAISGAGPLPGGKSPDVAITFESEEVTAAALSSRLDGAAAVGLGQITIRGLVPLADSLGVVMDRVEAYLQP